MLAADVGAELQPGEAMQLRFERVLFFSARIAKVRHEAMEFLRAHMPRLSAVRARNEDVPAEIWGKLAAGERELKDLVFRCEEEFFALERDALLAEDARSWSKYAAVYAQFLLSNGPQSQQRAQAKAALVLEVHACGQND